MPWSMGYTLINRDDPSIESFRDVFFNVVAGADGLTYVVVAAKPKPEYDGRCDGGVGDS